MVFSGDGDDLKWVCYDVLWELRLWLVMINYLFLLLFCDGL